MRCSVDRGRLAQLGERCVRNAEVGGSIPPPSTNSPARSTEDDMTRESSRDQLRAQAEKITWYHTMDIGSLRTRGSDNTASQLKAIQMPDSLAGLTVLDVGAWDGFYSFEAERRGAKRVLATDRQAWRSQETLGWGTGKAGFEFARRELGS